MLPSGAAVGPAAPSASTVAPPAAPAASGYEPPGRFNGKSSATEESRPLASARSGDRIAIPVDARDLSTQPLAPAGRAPVAGSSTFGDSQQSARVTPAAAASGAAAAAGSPEPLASAGRQRITQTIGPRPSEPDAALPGPAPSRTDGPRHEASVIGIMDLPAAAAASPQATLPASSGVQLASATAPLDAAAGVASASPDSSRAASAPSARYGHAPDHAWLRGRLEYSQIDRRWKLRYIPIDGKTDDFGGSVLIADDSVLSGFERGEFVEVHGQLDAAARNDRNFSPDYAVRQIKRIAD